MQNLIYSLDEITYFQYYSLFFVVRMTFLLSRSKAVRYIIHGNFHHCSFSCLIELFPKCQIEVCLVRGKCCENQKGNNKLKFACVRARNIHEFFLCVFVRSMSTAAHSNSRLLWWKESAFARAAQYIVLTTVVVRQNAGKNAVFGNSVVFRFPSSNGRQLVCSIKWS